MKDLVVILLDHRPATREGIVLMYEGNLDIVGGYHLYLSPQQSCPCPCLLESGVESEPVAFGQSH